MGKKPALTTTGGLAAVDIPLCFAPLYDMWQSHAGLARQVPCQPCLVLSSFSHMV
jgi:hypothetical protein